MSDYDQGVFDGYWGKTFDDSKGDKYSDGYSYGYTKCENESHYSEQRA